MNIIPYLILVTAFVLGQFARIQFGNVGITLIDIVVVCFVLVWFSRQLASKRKIMQLSYKKKLFIGFSFSGLVGLYLFSFKLSVNEVAVASLYLFRLLCYLSLFYIFRKLAIKNKQMLVRGLVLGGVGILFIGYLQYFFYQALGNLRYLGWDEHLYRLFSSFLDPNFAGAFLAIYLIFVLEIILSAGNLNKKIVFGCLAVLTFVAEILTYSRTGFIMLLVGVCTYLLISVGKKAVLASIILCLGLFLLASNPKIEGLNPFRTASTIARLESVGEAVSIIGKAPLFGVGFNAYRYALVESGFREDRPQVESHSDSGTDNSYLFILATTGVLGGVFFILWILDNLKEAWQAAVNKVYLGPSFFASFISVLIGSLFNNILFFPMILGWIVVMASVTLSKKS